MESIKVPRNIIIESNNSVSKNNEGFDINKQLNSNENIKESKNNSRWNTVISNPIKLEVGDEVNILTASINQIGSGNSSIEFLGGINNSTLTDNSVRFDMNYYITNELKFNLPLPLSTTIFTNNHDVLSIYKNDYLHIDLSTLENFQKAFPYENLENKKFIPGKLYHTNNDRMYMCQKDWSGLYTDSYNLTTETGFDNIVVGDTAVLHSNIIDVNLPIGLETPSNIASKVTYIFHQELDITDKSLYIEPISTQIHNTTIKDNFFIDNKNLFQEKSYFAVANPPSRGIYAEKQRGLINDMFFKETSQYNFNKLNKLFWENTLMNDVDRINSLINFRKITDQNNFSNDTITAPVVNPQFYTFMNDVISITDTITIGTTGLNMVIGDYLNLKDDYETFNFYYDRQIEDQCLDLKPGDVIMTNLLNTSENIKLLSDSFKLTEFPIEDKINYPSGIPNFNNQLFKNTLVSDLQFGCIDDSIIDINKNFNSQIDAHGKSLPFTINHTPRSFADNENGGDFNANLVLPGNYSANRINTEQYLLDSSNHYLITDDYLKQQSFDSLQNTNSGKNEKFGYNVKVNTRYNKNRVKNLPNNTLFELDEVNEDLFKENDIGLVSAKRKTRLSNLNNDRQAPYHLILSSTSSGSTLNDIPMTVGIALNVIDSNFLRIQPKTPFSKIELERSGVITNIYNDPNVTRTPLFNSDGIIINYAYNYFLPVLTTGFNLNIKTVGSTNIFTVTIRTPSQLYFDKNFVAVSKFRYENRRVDLTSLTNANITALELNFMKFKKYMLYFGTGSNGFTFNTPSPVIFSQPSDLHPIVGSQHNNLLFNGSHGMVMRIIDYNLPSVYIKVTTNTTNVEHFIKVNISPYLRDLENVKIEEKSFLGFVVKETYDISIPRPSIFEHFGVSKSICDNQLAFPITVQKQDVLKNDIITYYDTDTTLGSYETNLMIGSNLLNLDFNNINSRMEFKNFHQPTTAGQGSAYCTFNKAVEITNAENIPPLAGDPGLQIQKIYQKENIFSYISDQNLLWGIGKSPPKGSKFIKLPNDNTNYDFTKLYNSSGLAKTNSLIFTNSAVQEENGFIYDNNTSIQIAKIELYPSFVTGTLSGSSLNYGIAYTGAELNFFPFKLLIQGSNNNSSYETIIEYTAKTPLTQSPITNIVANNRVPNCINTIVADNFFAKQIITLPGNKAYRYYKFTLAARGTSLQGGFVSPDIMILSKMNFFLEDLGDGKIISDGIISAQCGSAIKSLSVPKINGDYHLINNTNPITYEKTLLDKLGFNLLTLLPLYGQPSIRYDRFLQNEFSSYNSKAYLMYKNQVKPVTTNAKLDGSIIQAFVKNAYQYPMFNLGTPSHNRQGQTTAESDTITATNLAEKYSYPYLTIYSNFISNHNDYYGGNEVSPLNIFGIVNRSYSASDYTFLQDNQISYIVEREQIINNFDVQIRLPNGNEIELNTESSVIFRVNKTKDLYISEMKYNCQDCDFHTNDKTKYDKHNKTKKHLNKIKE